MGNNREIVLNQVPIEWKLDEGHMTFFGRSAATFWLNPSLFRMLKPLAEEVGFSLFRLLIAHQASHGTEEDYHSMVNELGDSFEEGFLAWGKAVSAAGWGVFELPKFDETACEAIIRVRNPWELKMQQGENITWGCPFLKGKIIGILTHALGKTCWADEKIIDSSDQLIVEFHVYASNKTIKNELEILRNERREEKERLLSEEKGRLKKEIAERKKGERILADQAIRDPLTGLYNRRFFHQRMKKEMVKAQRRKDRIVFMLCDLDGFKRINDTMGHQAGDNALKLVIKCIESSIRGSDLLFRWGGDEFLVALLPDASREGALIVADRIREKVGRAGKKRYPGLDVSIGIATYPEHGTERDELIRVADRAMYIAKKGGEKVHVGEEEYHLTDKSIRIVFQPVMDVRTHQIIGYEALSRDPQNKQSVQALFKKYYAIGQLHELKCLCFQLQFRAAQEAHLKKVFLNVDFEMLEKIEIPSIPPNMEVVLEISESEILEDVDFHIKTALKWRKEGYKFALDDFGAGFVSLPFITRLMPDYIKLDRSTVLQAVSSDQFRSFLQDLILVLQKLTTEGIIAEGIETEKELSVMKEMGVWLIQGYLFGKPKALQ